MVQLLNHILTFARLWFVFFNKIYLVVSLMTKKIPSTPQKSSYAIDDKFN